MIKSLSDQWFEFSGKRTITRKAAQIIWDMRGDYPPTLTLKMVIDAEEKAKSI